MTTEIMEEEIPLTTFEDMIPLAKTGDNSKMMVFFGGAAVAAGALGAWVIVWKRRKKS